MTPQCGSNKRLMFGSGFRMKRRIVGVALSRYVHATHPSECWDGWLYTFHYQRPILVERPTRGFENKCACYYYNTNRGETEAKSS
jgi:hypothetical protein